MGERLLGCPQRILTSRGTTWRARRPSNGPCGVGTAKLLLAIDSISDREPWPTRTSGRTKSPA
jgi:hypothetical protein